MAKNDKGTDFRTDTLDDHHQSLWRASKIRFVFRIGILANFCNLQILPKLGKDFDILRDDFNILFCLADAGPMTGTEICRITGRPRNSVSRCADRLVRRKLVKMRADPDDKRMSVFEILPAGRKLYTAMLPHFVSLEKQMFSGLSDSEHEALDMLLSKLFGFHSTWESAV